MNRIMPSDLERLRKQGNMPPFQREALIAAAEAMGPEPGEEGYNKEVLYQAALCLMIGDISDDVSVVARLYEPRAQGNVHYVARFGAGNGASVELDTQVAREFAEFWEQHPDNHVRILMLGGPVIRKMWNDTVVEASRAELLSSTHVPLVRAAMHASKPLQKMGLVDGDTHKVYRQAYYMHLARVTAAKAVASGFNPLPNNVDLEQVFRQTYRIMRNTGLVVPDFVVTNDPYRLQENGRSERVEPDAELYWRMLVEAGSKPDVESAAKDHQLILSRAVWPSAGKADKTTEPSASLKGAIRMVLACGGVHEGDPSYERMLNAYVATHPDHLTSDVKRAFEGIRRMVQVFTQAGLDEASRIALFIRPRNPPVLQAPVPFPNSLHHISGGIDFIAKMEEKVLFNSGTSFKVTIRHGNKGKIEVRMFYKASQDLQNILNSALEPQPGDLPVDEKLMHPRAVANCVIEGDALVVKSFQPTIEDYTAREVMFSKKPDGRRVLDHEYGSSMLLAWKRFPMLAGIALHKIMAQMRLSHIVLKSDLTLKPNPDTDLTGDAAARSISLLNAMTGVGRGRMDIKETVSINDSFPRPVGGDPIWKIYATQVEGRVAFKTLSNAVAIKTADASSDMLALADLNALRGGSVEGYSGDPYSNKLHKDDGRWLSIGDAVKILREAESGDTENFAYVRLGEIGLPRFDGIPSTIMIRRFGMEWLATVNSALGESLESHAFKPQSRSDTLAIESMQGILAQLRDSNAYESETWDLVLDIADGDFRKFVKRIDLPRKRAVAHA